MYAGIISSTWDNSKTFFYSILKSNSNLAKQEFLVWRFSTPLSNILQNYLISSPGSASNTQKLVIIEIWPFFFDYESGTK